MLRIKIRNNFIQTSGSTTSSKYVTLPLNLEFTPTDYEEQREEILKEEREKAINNPSDGERIRYTKNGGTTINVRFYDGTNFVPTYEPMGFSSSTDFIKQSFKRSFYRLYFYDGINDNNNNLLFTEDINTLGNTPTLNLDRLFWLRNDNYFVTNGTDRDVYMDMVFFNAKNGTTHKLINLPLSITSPPLHNTVVGNPNWLKYVFTLKNPNTNNGYYNFTTSYGDATLTEDIRQ